MTINSHLREVGSEFIGVDVTNELNHFYSIDIAYVLSGRTAIDLIIKKVLISRIIKVAYLPDYCCESMIEPFIKNNIKVIFYKVSFIQGRFLCDINLNLNFDVILLIDYFGTISSQLEIMKTKIRDKNKIIIDDMTHSIFSRDIKDSNSDFSFASMRKWSGFCAGAIIANDWNEKFIVTKNSTNNKYTKLRSQAQELKSEYIKYGKLSKKLHLELFAEAERLLELDYQECFLDSETVSKINHLDISSLKSIRGRNAQILISKLSDLSEISMTLFDIPNNCPLFIPIFVKNGKRDKLKRILIENGFYCPVHWPISNHIVKHDSSLYENMLSLICDQRYTTDDMHRMSDLIINFFRSEEK